MYKLKNRQVHLIIIVNLQEAINLHQFMIILLCYWNVCITIQLIRYILIIQYIKKKKKKKKKRNTFYQFF